MAIVFVIHQIDFKSGQTDTKSKKIYYDRINQWTCGIYVISTVLLDLTPNQHCFYNLPRDLEESVSPL